MQRLASYVPIWWLCFSSCGFKLCDFLGRNNDHSRVRRQSHVGLTEGQKEEFVGIHNDLRRTVAASDMEHVYWSNYLASMAQEHVSGCLLVSGQPPRDPLQVPFDPLGQNLHWNTDEAFNVTRVVLAWFGESGNCGGKGGDKCPQFSQVVWASTRELGCGYAFCSTLKSLTDESVRLETHYVTCYYGPVGDVVGSPAYQPGPACSRCLSGQAWCDRHQPRGLCRRDCQNPDVDCDCHAVCENEANVSCACQCECSPGWAGPRCDKKVSSISLANKYATWNCFDSSKPATPMPTVDLSSSKVETASATGTIPMWVVAAGVIGADFILMAVALVLLCVVRRRSKIRQQMDASGDPTFTLRSDNAPGEGGGGVNITSFSPNKTAVDGLPNIGLDPDYRLYTGSVSTLPRGDKVKLANTGFI